MDIDHLNRVAKDAIAAFPWLSGAMDENSYAVALSLLTSILADYSDDEFLEEFEPLIDLLAFSINAYEDKLSSEEFTRRIKDSIDVEPGDVERLKNILSKKLLH